MKKIVIAVFIFLTLVSSRPFLAKILTDKALEDLKPVNIESISRDKILTSEENIQRVVFVDEYGEIIPKLLGIEPRKLANGIYIYREYVFVKMSEKDVEKLLEKMVVKTGIDAKACRVTILSEGEFNKKADQQEKKYEDEMLSYFDTYISNLSQTITENNAKLVGIINERDKYVSEADLWQKDCLARFSSEQCSEGITEIENIKNDFQSSIDLFNKTIRDQNSEQVKVYIDKSDFQKSMKNKSKSKLQSVNMRGLTQGNDIHLKNTAKSYLEYLNTYVHELNHCLTWKDESLPPYFEEGATDYYAQKLMSKIVQNSYEKTYPFEYSAYEKLLFFDRSFEDIYKSKDTDRLCQILESMSDKPCKEINTKGDEIFYAYNTDNQWKKYYEFMKQFND